MAFKRSAVRSRLSPPGSPEIVRFQDFFFCKPGYYLQKSVFSEPGRYTPVCVTLCTRIVPESRRFQEVQYVQMRGFRMLRKCVGKFLDCGQPYRVLHMQIVLCHIHIRVSNDTLDCRKVNTQHLHLGNVGMPPAMGCQDPYPLDGFQVELSDESHHGCPSVHDRQG